MYLEFPIYPGRSNSVKIALTNNNAVIDHTKITRLAIYVGSTLFDSQATPAMFDKTNAGHVEIKLGAASPAIAAGRYTCRLIVYDDGAYTLGLIVPVAFVVSVLTEPS
ncbi:hypothetical protein [Methylomicrobium sp. Wu6]|uniref:hypothetical protein n=1 Tax=Methylomicrobium sp. Wu6 TaxID=3107928 RepID=UPI002DD68DFF|nr:hypothetical protein [Methylomicrobium sp. Wu6]MEC4749996.1 hypothetical protein [Methylomicrobium sp. Wu6]